MYMHVVEPVQLMTMGMKAKWTFNQIGEKLSVLQYQPMKVVHHSDAFYVITGIWGFLCNFY